MSAAAATAQSDATAGAKVRRSGGRRRASGVHRWCGGRESRSSSTASLLLLVHLFLLGDRLGDRGLCLGVPAVAPPRLGRAAAASASAASIAASSSSGGSSPPSGHDERLHLDADVLEELDRHGEAADALERVDRDLAPVDAHLPRAPDLVGDVGRCHRAEERTGRAGFHLEPKHGLAEKLGDLLRLLGVRASCFAAAHRPSASSPRARASRSQRACGEAGSSARSHARRRRRLPGAPSFSTSWRR